jgi:hypothetical protein
MADEEALILLKKFAESDHRRVKGSWSVSKQAHVVIRTIQKGEEGEREGTQAMSVLLKGRFSEVARLQKRISLLTRGMICAEWARVVINLALRVRAIRT